MIQLDILPTALAAVGVEVRSGDKLEGVNLLPYLTGENRGQPHDALYWRFGTQMAIRKGDWKLVKYDLAADNSRGTSPMKLYNLNDDIAEANDLLAKQPEKVKELQADWDQWNKSNVPPLWGGKSDEHCVGCLFGERFCDQITFTHYVHKRTGQTPKQFWMRYHR